MNFYFQVTQLQLEKEKLNEEMNEYKKALADYVKDKSDMVVKLGVINT